MKRSLGLDDYVAELVRTGPHSSATNVEGMAASQGHFKTGDEGCLYFRFTNSTTNEAHLWGTSVEKHTKSEQLFRKFFICCLST